MTHARQQVRDAVIAAVDGLTTTGARVMNSPAYQASADDCPLLNVFSGTESRTESVFIGDRAQVTSSVFIEAWSSRALGYQSQLDTICEEVEIALAGDANLNDMVEAVHLVETELEYMPELDQPTAIARMEVQIIYSITWGDPSTIIGA